MIIEINGIQLYSFIVNEINLNYDAVSDTFSLTMPFSPDGKILNQKGELLATYRKLFKPLSYPDILIYNIDPKTKKKIILLTGTILNSVFKSNSNANELAISGYSKTGILDDCPDMGNATAGDNLSEGNNTEKSTCYNGLTLLELAKTLVNPFNIEIEVDPIVKDKLNEPYDQATTSPDDTVASYLGKLATLKNVVMRSTPSGHLKFTQVDEKEKAKYHFEIDREHKNTNKDVVDISLSVNGQAMHSMIEIMGRADLFNNPSGSSDIITNPLVKSKRPTVKTQGTETTRITDVCKAALAEELKNIAITVECRGFDLIENGILTVGDIVTIKAPDVFIYDTTRFLIRTIKLKEDANGQTVSFTCNLPQTMTGNTPEIKF